jgi:hypothetical protein
MTKYEEMGSWAEAATSERQQYEKESTAFAHSLVNGLQEYLGCAYNRLVVSPALGNPHFPPNPGKAIALPGAMHIGEQGYWYFRCAILQIRALPETRQEQVFPVFPIITFMFKKDKNWEVTTTHFNEKFQLASGYELRDMQPLFDRLVEAIRKFYSNLLRNQIEGKKDKFGFAAGVPEPK